MDIKIIEKTGYDSNKKAETDTEIKGMQGGKHIITKKKAVVEIRVQVDKCRYERQVQKKGN